MYMPHLDAGQSTPQSVRTLHSDCYQSGKQSDNIMKSRIAMRTTPVQDEQIRESDRKRRDVFKESLCELRVLKGNTFFSDLLGDRNNRSISHFGVTV